MESEIRKEIKLTEEHVRAIEKALNGKGTAEVIVKLESGKRIVVLQSHKKRIM